MDDPYAKGVTVGLHPVAPPAGHLYRALLEGLAFGMREVYLQLREVGAPDEVHPDFRRRRGQHPLVPDLRGPFPGPGPPGSGIFRLRRSWARPCWPPITARTPRRCPGRFASFGSDRTFEPDVSKKAVYDDLFAVYTQIYPASKGIFQALKHFDETH